MSLVRLGTDSEHLAFTRDGADMAVRVRHEGVEAATRVWLDYIGQAESLVAFFESLDHDWRGWSGERTWASLEGELRLTATHDRLGTVGLRIALRHKAGSPSEWSLVSNVSIEAGEEMSAWCRDLALWAAVPRL